MLSWAPVDVMRAHPLFSAAPSLLLIGYYVRSLSKRAPSYNKDEGYFLYLPNSLEETRIPRLFGNAVRLVSTNYILVKFLYTNSEAIVIPVPFENKYFTRLSYVNCRVLYCKIVARVISS